MMLIIAQPVLQDTIAQRVSPGIPVLQEPTTPTLEARQLLPALHALHVL